MLNIPRIVRPATRIESKLPDPPKPRTPLPGEGSDAFISWGQQADMSVASTTQTGTISALPASNVDADLYTRSATSGSVFAPASLSAGGIGGMFGSAFPIVHGARSRPRPPVPQDNQPGIISYDMIDGQWETIKVYSPDDKDVWVKVQRLTSCRFRAANGNIIKLNLKTLPAPKPPE